MVDWYTDRKSVNQQDQQEQMLSIDILYLKLYMFTYV